MSEANIKEKKVLVDEIKDKLSRAQSAVAIDYMGTTVDEANKMRKKLREADVDYKVYKNTYIKRAIEGSAFAELEVVLEGPTALAISFDDATAPARVLSGIMKEYKKMEFKAGFVEGDFYDAEGITSIASIPSREELIAKFMGSIQSPVGKFVRTLQAVADAKPEVGEPAEAPVEAPAEEAKEAAPAEAVAEPPAEEVKEEAAPAETPAG